MTVHSLSGNDNLGSLACKRSHHFFFFAEVLLCSGSSSEGTMVATAAPSGIFTEFFPLQRLPILFEVGCESCCGCGSCSWYIGLSKFLFFGPSISPLGFDLVSRLLVFLQKLINYLANIFLPNLI